MREDICYKTYKNLKLYFDKNLKGKNVKFRVVADQISYLVSFMLWAFDFFLVAAGVVFLTESLKGHSDIDFDLNLFFDVFFAGKTTSILWFGVFLFMILYYYHYVWKGNRSISILDPTIDLIKTGRKTKKAQKKLNIAKYFDPFSIKTLNNALDNAYSERRDVQTEDLLYALLFNKDIFSVFAAQNISIKNLLIDAWKKVKKKKNINNKKVYLNKSIDSILINSFLEAIKLNDKRVKPKHIMIAVMEDKKLNKIFRRYKISKNDFL